MNQFYLDIKPSSMGAEGWYLDNRYEINKCRTKQGMRKLVSSKEANFQWSTVEPDIHSSD